MVTRIVSAISPRPVVKKGVRAMGMSCVMRSQEMEGGAWKGDEMNESHLHAFGPRARRMSSRTVAG